MYEDIGATTVVGEELYHYGRKGMKWYQHIYGPVQTVAKYAKKVGSKLSDAKASHDKKQLDRFEKKKEDIIRSGDAKIIRKNQDKLSDAELKRAFDRLKNTPSDPEQKQKQGQDFINKKGNMSAKDLIKSFSDLASDIDTAYKAVDKLIGVKNDIKKYTPEERAKAAEKKRIIAENDVDSFLSKLSMFNDNEKKAFNQVGIAIDQVRNREKSKYEASKQAPDFGPQTLTQQTRWKDYVDSMNIKYGSASTSKKRADPLLSESSSVSLWEKALDEAKRTPVSERELQQAYEHILDEQRRR